MNRLFVNIKVDREERPDLDQIYQTAHQMLAQRTGGWPLTMFLTPERRAVLRRHLLSEAAALRHAGLRRPVRAHRRDLARASASEIEEQNAERCAQAFERTLPPARGRQAEFSRAPLDRRRCSRTCAQTSTRSYGGFGGGAQVPASGRPRALPARTATRDTRRSPRSTLHVRGRHLRPAGRRLLPLQHRRALDDSALREDALRQRAAARACYADAWLVSASRYVRARAPRNRGVGHARDAIAGRRLLLLARRRSASTRKASSTCGTADEVQALAHARRVRRRSRRTSASTARRTSRASTGTCMRSVRRCDAKRGAASIRRARSSSPRARSACGPGATRRSSSRWNALVIRGMAHAARVFGAPEWLASARRALDFIRAQMWRDGRLLATYKDGRAHLNAYLDDYAFLHRGAARAHAGAIFGRRSAIGRRRWPTSCSSEFEDSEDGRILLYRRDHERLIHRPKPGQDNAMPSGNAVAAWSARAAGYLTGSLRYVAGGGAHAASSSIRRCATIPAGYAAMAIALAEQIRPPNAR